MAKIEVGCGFIVTRCDSCGERRGGRKTEGKGYQWQRVRDGFYIWKWFFDTRSFDSCSDFCASELVYRYDIKAKPPKGGKKWRDK